MKYLAYLMIFILPFNALIVTFLKCKSWINVDFLRFWKEFVVLFLFFWWVFSVLRRYKFNLSKIYENNMLLWSITAFSFLSFFYVFFPYFRLEIHNFLWFKFDVFFLFALVWWLYLFSLRDSLESFLKTIFSAIWIILLVFLPWHIFWDVSLFSDIFWHSKELSKFQFNSCISFAQSVDWIPRFQASFWWPIRFSVFLTVFFFLFLWYFIDKKQKSIVSNKIFYPLILAVLLAYLVSIYLSLTKTVILWFLFWLFVFFLFLLDKFNIKIKSRFIAYIWWWLAWLASIFVYIKRDLFLHLGSVLDRLNSLKVSKEMFFENPIWYWLWVAWPASSISDARFWPENWFIQIALEQWILWLALFILVIFYIFKALFLIYKKKRDYLSIWFFVSFSSLVFMSNFTHAFEETATSYILFLLIWIYIAKNLNIKKID